MDLANEIQDLEEKLAAARARQTRLHPQLQNGNPQHPEAPQTQAISKHHTDINLNDLNTNILHALLLLSDSALPLGSFAFSSGLESALAHQKAALTSPFTPKPPTTTTSNKPPTPKTRFDSFLLLSVQSLASTALPYVLAAWRDPDRLGDLDDEFDASTPCTVARRASLAQGRGLLGVWERSYRGHEVGVGGVSGEDFKGRDVKTEAQRALAAFLVSLKVSHNNNSDDDERTNPYPPSGHLPPLWGTVTKAMGLDIQTSAYLFLFSHARTIVSAAVRASVLGPYQAQMELANPRLRGHIEALMSWNWDVDVEEAGQSVPVVDLWMGRHELLYSRIFNS